VLGCVIKNKNKRFKILTSNQKSIIKCVEIDYSHAMMTL
jgi:hypothetical protein